MDYQRQAYLQNCEAYLMSPDNIEPNELAQYLAASSHLGLNDYITSLVQRYFYVNLNHPELVRYIHLLDRLIKFSFPLPLSFINMFAQCFRHSIENGRKSIQQQLKILRKLWTPILNDNIIADLRSEVFKITNIDIDHNLREESKKFLQQYFEKNMMLGPHAIYQILHKKIPLRNQQILKEVINTPQFLNHPRFVPSTLELGKPAKKPKLSEDTEAQFKQPSKREQALLILNKLRDFNSYFCKQCGKYFQTQNGLQEHKIAHFDQKMKKFNEKRSKQSLKKMKISNKEARKQMSIDQWNNSHDIQNVFIDSHVIIPLGQQLGINQSCTFCHQKFDVSIVNDCFVYKNTIKVHLQELNIQKTEQFDLMHCECYKAVYQSTSE